MKKFLLSLLIVFGILLVPHNTKADVLPPNTHAVSTCVKIDNSLNNKLGEFAIVGYYEGPGIEDHEAYIVQTEDGSTDHTTACLYKGYKLNNFHLLAVRKSYLDKVGLENIDIDSPDVYVNDDIALNQVTVANSDPTDTITQIYSIDGLSDGKLYLDKEKQTTSYNDGSAEKIETFEEENCVLNNCANFSDYKCVSESELDADAICAAYYLVGDNCLQYVACGGESCNLEPSSEFTKCSNCIEECYSKKSEGTDVEQCSYRCSSADVINQGINTSPSPTASTSTTPSPTATKNIVKTLIDTGPNIYIILFAAIAIIFLIIIYSVNIQKKKGEK